MSMRSLVQSVLRDLGARVASEGRRLWARVDTGPRGLPTFYHPAYRLPVAAAEGRLGIEPRRADLALWYLLEHGILRPADVRTAHPVLYADLLRVHSPRMLEDLTRPERLGAVFWASPTEIVVDEVMHTVRLAAGATLEAARLALERGGPTLNLLGGFHHAGPDHPGPLCPVNDIAVAVAALRAGGFGGQVVVLDFDAHPPDGTALCLRGDEGVAIGSISGPGWGVLEGVDETVLPEGADDLHYLEALEALLGRMPAPALAFVLAGGDVLGGDRMGRLGLSLEGAQRRDLRVRGWLAGAPSVWIPAGGYHAASWKVVAGTAHVLRGGELHAIEAGYDPLDSRFRWAGAQIDPARLRATPGDDLSLSLDDLEVDLGLRPGQRLLLGYYTAEGIEFALAHYGVLTYLSRLGYGQFRVTLDRNDVGERARLWATCLPADGAPGRDPASATAALAGEQLLIELTVERKRLGADEVLYVHFLTLRHTRGHFRAGQPALPGQDAPGLGLAREMGELLVRMAERLGLAGVAFRPAWYHVAYMARHYFQFADARRQGRFEALQRDLGQLPMLRVTLAAAEGRVQMNGEPYRWEADAMVHWLTPRPLDTHAVAEERDRVRFTLA